LGYHKVEDTIQEAYKNVELFNSIAGNLDNVTPESIDNQLSFIFEELTETIEAVERGMFEDLDADYNPEVELVDGVCDLFVTVAGLIQKMEVAGFDVAGALKKVNDNNLQKFPQWDVRKNENELAPPNTRTIIDGNHCVLIFKDKDTGKIKKPTNFVPVNLSGHEVAGFLSSNKGGV
jgi:hypothetical protein